MANKRVFAQPSRIIGDFEVLNTGAVSTSIAIAEDDAIQLSYNGTTFYITKTFGGSGSLAEIDRASGMVTVSGITVSGSVSLPNNVITRAAMVDGAAASVIGRSGTTSGAVADIVAFSANTVLARAGDGPLAFTSITNSMIGANQITPDRFAAMTGPSVIGVVGAGPTYPSGIFAMTNDRLLARTSGTLDFVQLTAGMVPSSLVTNAMLRDSAACSVIGRSANSSGVSADITASTNDRLLARTSDAVSWVQLTAGMFPNDVVSNSILRNSSALSVIGRSANSTGDPADVASASGSGDSLFVENSVVVFDNWIRQRRNINRGFWDFEMGGTGVTTGAQIPGTPFVSTVTATATLSQANRNTTYTRNTLTPICYTAGSLVAVTLPYDTSNNGVGLPVNAGVIVIECAISLNSLSNATNEYTLQIGAANNAIADDGVFFQYLRTSSTNWRLVARNGGTTTVTTSSSAVAAAGYRLRIEITSTTNANFYVNGTLVGSVTSNIPAQVFPGFCMAKTASDGSPTFHDVDYMAYQQVLATPRSATSR